jgi:type II secretory pathway component GspD/PulD (secretin)
MKTARFLLAFAFAGWAVAQTTSDQDVTRVVRVHNVDASKLAEMVGHGTRLHGLDSDNTLHVIVLKGPGDVVDACERTIKELDIPTEAAKSVNLEVTVYVLGAAKEANALPQSPVPPELGPVIKQLRAIFPYGDYQSLTSMLLRSADGKEAQNLGGMMSPDDTANRIYPYTVRYDRASRSGQGSTIHLDKFEFRTKTPADIVVYISTGVDLKEGQKVVVGKANVDAKGTALFIVLSARIID